MKSSEQKSDLIEAEYKLRYDSVLTRIAINLSEYLSELLKKEPRIDRISARAKEISRFVKKASTQVDGKPKYNHPLVQIQDQVGARIIVFYKADVDRIDAAIRKYFTAVEFRDVVPDSISEFSYFGRHLILSIPSDVLDEGMDKHQIPDFFELQIKTLFQHAWSEADHDLGYKPGETPLTPEQKRLIAFTSAQAWGADHMFDQLFQERASA